ncbi:polyprenyl synthetase family protein [Litorihabitans aurantiacus]|uniref:Polyprenyl synthetase family protein n=1 Tax=Litorihabitans aurantiacus TaxID=1930061 RepID=A0AA37XG13_9MICO|nr:polyprenyl synthetase family protein [Litorihabitans aurantiacus]GMA32863.1 hypothetical protein GCM10025875_28550 [Litorihabitans aurantiacus]
MPEALRVASPRIADFVDVDGVTEVRRRLAQIPREQGRRAAAYSPELAQIWGVIGENLVEGKLVRPAILLAVADTVSAASDTSATSNTADITPDPAHDARREAVLELAVAVEMLHLAFLLHDDVIDHDTVRRGRPNLIARIGREITAEGASDAERRAVGEAAGILAGDLVLSQAHQCLARIDAPADVRRRLLELLQETLQHSVAGELADVGYSLRAHRPSLADVLTMSQSKTGAYTVRLPLLWALIALEADVPDELEDFAAALGLAFQLQDDLLGLFGDPALVGKDPVSDIREGKYTAVMAHASSTPEWAEISSHLGRADITPDDAARVLALLESSGARAAAQDDLERALTDARRIADEAGALRGVLQALVAALTERRS